MARALTDHLALQAQLEACERIIHDAWPSFTKYRDIIGEQLVIIRDKKLYLVNHKTFREYVEKELGCSVRRAQMLIESKRPEPLTPGTGVQNAQILRNNTQDSGQSTEDEEAQVEAAEEVADNTDTVGAVIPQSLEVVFSRVDDFKVLALDVADVLRRATALANTPSGAVLRAVLQSIETDAKNLKTAIKFATPYAVCPACDGMGDPKCHCKDSGWLTQDAYKSLPEELRGD